MMKFAVQYRRISQKDQSYHSLTSQGDHIGDFAKKHDYNIVNDFCDDGRSAKNFDRPAWKKLIKYLKSNSHIKYILIYDYSRFSRNAGEALELIARYERVHQVHIISISQHIPLNPADPMYFDFRARMLVHAETERRMIADRTNRGIRSARESGRVGSMAPFGYINYTNPGEKPNIKKTGKHEYLFEQIFNDVFVLRLPIHIAFKNARKNGYTRKSHNAFSRLLRNPTYYGLVNVVAYRDKEAYIKESSFEGYFPPECYYIAKTFFPSIIE